jgi:hypothetical protein
LSVKTADGTEEAFRLTDHAAEDAGKDISEGVEKSGKVTVYYTEKAGHKVAHFFSKVLEATDKLKGPNRRRVQCLNQSPSLIQQKKIQSGKGEGAQYTAYFVAFAGFGAK